MSKSGMKQAILCGLKRHCPVCDAPTLFAGYLRVRPICPNCGAANGEHRVDDIASYFTVLLVGHIVLAPMLALPVVWELPGWVAMTGALGLITIATLGALPFIKGGVIGALSVVGHRHT